MRVLDLFSGIGGFSLGLERAGMQTVAFCEVDQFCRKKLNQNFPGIPIYEDIRTLRKTRLESDGIRNIDLICGGFPCQSFSNAGKRKGKDDNRDLWPEMFRVIQEYGPAWVIGENVVGFVNLELKRTIADLEGQGYQVRAFNIPACAVEAPHERKRIWIIAHRNSNGRCGILRETGQRKNEPEQRENLDGESFGNGGHGPTCKEILADPHNRFELRKNEKVCTGGNSLSTSGQNVSHTNRQWPHSLPVARSRRGAIGEQKSHAQPEQTIFGCNGAGNGWQNWTIEPDVGRVAYGVPDRVDRIKALGNAVVPQILEVIGRAIMEIEAIANG